MITKMKAVTSFVHGNKKYDEGDDVEVTKGDADGLEKAGLVVSAEDQRAEVEADGKMDSAPQNKMEPDPANKMDQAVMQEPVEEAHAEEDKPATGKASPRKTASKKAD
jgi:hypothetical protein